MFTHLVESIEGTLVYIDDIIPVSDMAEGLVRAGNNFIACLDQPGKEATAQTHIKLIKH